MHDSSALLHFHMAPVFQKFLVVLALPLADRWVHHQEKKILNEGRELSEWEVDWAHDVGVMDVSRVRIAIVPEVPTPGSAPLQFLAKLVGLSMKASGMALGHGIYVEAINATNPSLIVHELVHVAQYERLGGIRNFLREYLIQCLRDGYWDAFLEREARELALKYARPPER